ncbi:hypothetical protein ALC62_08026 [Cyphomyrmex costatus]|uniref:Uncharacterized protein n=1 Tax=Cyphomyrmex costatus TaxID=456900 RepID=A0A195CM76_9HYME|nr:hypothetical protein ALC62_08026 [Cyphomyrmex costatus]
MEMPSEVCYLTSSDRVGTGNTRNVFSRPCLKLPSFSVVPSPSVYFCITPYFLSTMKPQTYKGLLFVLLPPKNSCVNNFPGIAFRASLESLFKFLIMTASWLDTRLGGVGVDVVRYYVEA